MKQAGRIWNHTLNGSMMSWGFMWLPCKSCIYYCKTDTGTVIAAAHVNNFLLIASSAEENEQFKNQMHQIWTISDLRLPKFIVGIAVKWDYKESSIRLSQTALIDKIILQTRQKETSLLSLPMDPGLKLRKIDQTTLNKDDQYALQHTPYRQLASCLLYITISTRPDIAYTVQQLTQYVDSYTHLHWNTAITACEVSQGYPQSQTNARGQRKIR